MKTQFHAFATFPKFSRLTLADREKYEALIADYPPISEIAFQTLVNWWDILGDCAISQIDDNLVISYWLPGVEKDSGLCVVGNKRVDESVATVLDWMKARGDQPRLVHVPEFVVSNMRYPELYTFSGERDYDECIVPVSKLAAFEQIIQHKRWKVRRFMTEVGEGRVAMESLDLSSEFNQQTLLELVDAWQHEGTFNNINLHERQATRHAISHAEALGMDNTCLYIDGKIHAFLIYHKTQHPRYVTIKAARISYEIPHIFEFSIFKFAQWLSKEGIRFANVELDLGLPQLRSAKLALGPTNFFRKYTIEPRSS